MSNQGPFVSKTQDHSGEDRARRILVMVTGSIAAYRVCSLISKLVQTGYEVQIAASPSALQFVGSATLEGLSHHAVISDLWEHGRAMDHIHCVRWADLILVAPASAHFINRTAQGVGDDLLTTMFLAHDFKKPFLIAPAMNTAMYTHPATQNSLKKLREWGIEILETASGVLACGEVGYGRLLDPELLFAEVESRLAQVDASLSPSSPGSPAFSTLPSKRPTQERKGSRTPKILVTSGGVAEPIDEVRSITNTSTGRTGALIADTLTELGFDVTCLCAATAVKPHFAKILPFTTYGDLSQVLREQLAKFDFDFVIHAAAVSDYSVAKLVTNGSTVAPTGKIPSGQEICLYLKPNAKIIDQIKEWSRNKKVKILAFKLFVNSQSSEDQKLATQKIFSASGAEFVLTNDLVHIGRDAQMGRGAQSDAHGFSILHKSGDCLAKGKTKSELLARVSELVVKEVQ